MKILRKMKFVSILLTFALVAGQFCIVNANAAQGVEAAPAGTPLSGFRITDIDKPLAGRTLDLTARVRTDQNVSWEIPVIWVDEFGNTATVAKPGGKYTPNFIFFVPKGYTIGDVDRLGQFAVKLPDFLIETFGTGSAIFVADVEKGITYITFVPEYTAGRASAVLNTSGSNVPVPAANTTAAKNNDDPDENHHQDSSPSSGGGGAVSPSHDTTPSLAEQVKIHCSQTAIDKLGTEVLGDLVDLIKNKLEPQAVALLRSSFYAYEQDPESLGEDMGLFIYYHSDRIDDDTNDGVVIPPGVAAFVSADRYMEDNSDAFAVFKYIIGVDTEVLMEKGEDGKYRFKESEKANIGNTIVHELMHAFMYDYTRRGMNDYTDMYPLWFMEGIASAVENVYQYRFALFQNLGQPDENTRFDKRLYRRVDSDGKPVRISYSAQSIYDKYTNPDTNLGGHYRFDLKWTGEPEHDGSAYVSGYLALVYLGYLSSVKSDKDPVTVPDLDHPEEPVTIDISMIKDGVSNILEMLHNGDSLDTVIRHISSDANDENPIFTSTADFQERFIKGAEGNSEMDANRHVGSSDSVYGSAAFCSCYLNYLESFSILEGDAGNVANGSILSDEQNYGSPLQWDWEPEAGVTYPYAIGDSEEYGKFVVSTVDFDRAWETGGRTTDHNQTESNDQTSDDTASLPAAAKTSNETIENVDDHEDDEASDEPDATKAAGAPETEYTTEATEATEVTEVTEVVQTEAAGEIPAVPEEVTPPGDTGLTPDVLLPDGDLSGEVTGEGEDLCILPSDEDAIVPCDPEPAFEPAADDGNAPSDGDAPSDGGDDGGDSSDDGGSDDGGDSSDSGSEESACEE